MDRAVSYLYELSAAAGGSVASNGGQSLGAGPSPGLSVNSQLPTDHLMAPGNDNYCLRWNEFEKKYAESFRHLRDNEYFTDVTLTTEGHSVKAHRVILSACSTYFHAILKSMAPWQHPVLMLQDVKPHDLNALMDFIYFGQVHMSQDSLPTFLKIAERLKIKGLCETLSPISMPPTPTGQIQHSGQRQMNQGMLPPMANSPHALVTTVAGQNQSAMQNSNFENLLPRSPYIPPDVNPGTSGANCVGSMTQSSSNLPPPHTVSNFTRTSAIPPAHQSPKQASRSGSNPRPESLVYVSPAKRTKYSSGPLSPQSILRNQLQLAKEINSNNSESGVEVKSEPMAILSSQEDVPSSGVNVQELMSSHEGDLISSAVIPQGISPHFMFSPEQGQANNNSSGILVESDQRSTCNTVRMESIVTSGGVVTSSHAAAGILVPTSHHLHSQPPHQGHQQHQLHHELQQQTQNQHFQTQPQQQQQQQMNQMQVQQEMHKEEPQDLTPTQHDSSPGGVAVMSSPSTPTPPKNGATPGSDKKTGARKSCPYCNKDFHEMSLKRHIKDVHFRSQDTVVICPQCCKQYASQNSLYSHLNRVHNVKKETIMSESGNLTLANNGGNSSAATQHNDEGQVNLTHHSEDSSNG